MSMKHAIEFRDPSIQALAEALFTPEQLKFLHVSEHMPIAPSNAEHRAAFEELISRAEQSIMRARQMLALTDLAVATNGGSFERILRYRDDESETKS